MAAHVWGLAVLVYVAVVALVAAGCAALAGLVVERFRRRRSVVVAGLLSGPARPYPRTASPGSLLLRPGLVWWRPEEAGAAVVDLSGGLDVLTRDDDDPSFARLTLRDSAGADLEFTATSDDVARLEAALALHDPADAGPDPGPDPDPDPDADPDPGPGPDSDPGLEGRDGDPGPTAGPRALRPKRRPVVTAGEVVRGIPLLLAVAGAVLAAAAGIFAAVTDPLPARVLVGDGFTATQCSVRWTGPDGAVHDADLTCSAPAGAELPVRPVPGLDDAAVVAGGPARAAEAGLGLVLVAGVLVVVRYVRRRRSARPHLSPRGATSDGATQDGTTPDGATPDGAGPEGDLTWSLLATAARRRSAEAQERAAERAAEVAATRAELRARAEARAAERAARRTAAERTADGDTEEPDEEETGAAKPGAAKVVDVRGAREIDVRSPITAPIPIGTRRAMRTGAIPVVEESSLPPTVPIPVGTRRALRTGSIPVVTTDPAPLSGRAAAGFTRPVEPGDGKRAEGTDDPSEGKTPRARRSAGEYAFETAEWARGRNWRTIGTRTVRWVVVPLATLAVGYLLCATSVRAVLATTSGETATATARVAGEPQGVRPALLPADLEVTFPGPAGEVTTRVAVVDLPGAPPPATLPVEYRISDPGRALAVRYGGEVRGVVVALGLVLTLAWFLLEPAATAGRGRRARQRAWRRGPAEDVRFARFDARGGEVALLIWLGEGETGPDGAVTLPASERDLLPATGDLDLRGHPEPGATVVPVHDKRRLAPTSVWVDLGEDEVRALLGAPVPRP